MSQPRTRKTSRILYATLAVGIAAAGVVSGQWIPATLTLAAMGLVEFLGHLEEAPGRQATSAPALAKVAQKA